LINIYLYLENLL